VISLIGNPNTAEKDSRMITAEITSCYYPNKHRKLYHDLETLDCPENNMFEILPLPTQHQFPLLLILIVKKN
jgi:hypothetical protein